MSNKEAKTIVNKLRAGMKSAGFVTIDVSKRLQIVEALKQARVMSEGDESLHAMFEEAILAAQSLAKGPTQSEVYDLVSRGVGMKEWNALSAALKPAPNQAARLTDTHLLSAHSLENRPAETQGKSPILTDEHVLCVLKKVLRRADCEDLKDARIVLEIESHHVLEIDAESTDFDTGIEHLDAEDFRRIVDGAIESASGDSGFDGIGNFGGFITDILEVSAFGESLNIK